MGEVDIKTMIHFHTSIRIATVNRVENWNFNALVAGIENNSTNRGKFVICEI